MSRLLGFDENGKWGPIGWSVRCPECGHYYQAMNSDAVDHGYIIYADFTPFVETKIFVVCCPKCGCEKEVDRIDSRI